MDEYEKLAKIVEAAGIIKSKFFGRPVLKLGAKPVAGLTEDGINFKLPADSADMKEALALPGAHLYQPVMQGKTGPIMKQWVVVPFDQSSHYEELVQASIEFVRSELEK